MEVIFEITDKTGRRIYLSKERWNHITTKHPYMSDYLEKVEETTRIPLKIIPMILGICLIFINIINIKREN